MPFKMNEANISQKHNKHIIKQINNDLEVHVAHPQSGSSST